ncbi:hypothetical protein [Azospirillum agricola]|uniref:hypothetical protein n=1 Tax=Azospirillum agricola TaxID=1720247 RepID=UPI000A0F0853|nr:hypothetical protein [Azospirillum agricola]MBP2230718.1 hypothetical protein [Azospirillum agricola]SMH51844.1 hypothetical protein SAMN02982994_2958 [Azospirillum lipoferum]
MFRSNRIFAPLAVLALIALSACADRPQPRAASTAAPVQQTQTLPRSTPAPDDQSLRLDGDASDGGSCRQQCERSHNVCMDSVAARTQSGLERPDAGTPFTPSDNCGYQLRQCFQRCNAAR